MRLSANRTFPPRPSGRFISTFVVRDGTHPDENPRSGFTSIAQAMRRTTAGRSRRTPGFYFAEATRNKTIPATAAGRFTSTLVASNGTLPDEKPRPRFEKHCALCAMRRTHAVRSRPTGGMKFAQQAQTEPSRRGRRPFRLQASCECEFRSIPHFIQAVDGEFAVTPGSSL